MPLGTPTAPTTVRTPAGRPRQNYGPPAPPSTPQTTTGGTTLTGNGQTQPATGSRPGGPTYYPPGSTPPARQVGAPVPITNGPPAGVTVRNYGLDDSTWQFLQSALAGSNAAYDGQNAMLGFDAAFANVGNQYDRAKLKLDYRADMARLGNSRYRDVDLARQGLRDGLAAGLRNFNTANRFADRRYGDATTAAQGAYGIDTGKLTAALGFAGRDFSLGQENADFQRAVALRQAGNQAAAAGAATSTGFEDTRGDIATQRQLSQTGLVNAFDQANSDIGFGFDTAKLNFDTTMAGAATARDQVREGAGNDWATQQADASRQSKYIQSIANDYGITGSQMKQAFSLGMQRLGLDNGLVMGKIAAAMQSNDQQKIAAATALQQQILMAAQG